MLQGQDIRRGESVSLSSLQVEPPPVSVAEQRARTARGPVAAPLSKPRLLTLLAVPVATSIALALHFFVAQKEPPAETHSYTLFLCVVLGAGILMAVVQPWWACLRRWMGNMCPILAAAVLLLSVCEMITSGLRLLPLP